MESTDQVTPVLVVPCTVAVNCAEAPAETVVELGEIETFTTGTVTVTVAVPFWVVSATLVAVTIGIAAWEGAVYKPLEVMVPPPTTDQVTLGLLFPATIALNC